jgi:hypothetical protein
MEEVPSPELRGCVSMAVVEVELPYEVVLLDPELTTEDVASELWEVIALADPDQDSDKVVVRQSLVVLVGNGKSEECPVMMEVLTPGRGARDIERELNVLISDGMVCEKLYPLLVCAAVTLPDEARLVGARLFVIVEVHVDLITDMLTTGVVVTPGGVIGVVMIEN